MNKLKKLIALLLTVAMCLTLVPAVFADGEAPEEATAEETVSGEDTPAQTEPPAPVEGDTGSESENQPEINLPLEEGEPAGEAPAEETDEPASDEADAEEGEDDSAEENTPRPWIAPGNSDAEILGGGRYLTSGDRFYYSEGGIWLSVNGGDATLLTWDNGTSLNLSGDYLYYISVNGDVRRMPAGGGDYEKVYAFEAAIEQLYVMGDELRFVSGGGAYSYDMATGELETLVAPDGVKGLIPTPYGNLYLTGAVREYTVWAETERLFDGVNQCYTDGDWLVVVKGGETLQASLAGLFEGNTALQAYSLHQDMLVQNGLSDEEQLANEAAFLESDTYIAMMEDTSEAEGGDGTFSVAASYATVSSTATSKATPNQKNVVMRARQMAEVLWTPLKWRYSWGGNESSYKNSSGAKVTDVDGYTTWGYFEAGSTYQGVPYSQAVYGKYVGWDISIDNFVSAVNSSSSTFYSKYSTYCRTAPIYGSDCSGFVSWAWDLPYRCTCTSLKSYSTYIGTSLSKLQLGDCINNPNSHVVLVTDIGYDSNNNIVSVEITEQTPAKMKVTCFGATIPGKTYKNTASLNDIYSRYLNSGYYIYRRSCSSRPNVGFTQSKVVPLDEIGLAPAPSISVSVNGEGTAKVVTLKTSVSGATIYYTTDGTEPSSSSTRYTGPFSVTKTTTVRAIAVSSTYKNGSSELNYSVTVERAQAPFVVLIDGDMSDEYVASGSKITIMNEAGDKVYYTTDGSTPTKSSTPAPTAGITITKDMTIKAVAVSDENLNSDVVSLTVKVGAFHKITATVNSAGGYVQPGGDIGVLHGRKQTITIVPLEHYKIASMTVDGKKINPVSSYTFENVTTDHTIAVTFAVDLPFTDVPNNWAAPYIEFAYSQNLFAGTDSNTFSPNNNMTRGMFISVLGRFAGNGQWTELNNWTGKLGVTNGSAIAIRSQTTTADGVSAILTRTGATGTRLKINRIVSSGVDGAMWYEVPYEWKDPNDNNRAHTSAYIRAVDTDNKKTLVYAYTGLFSDLPNGQYYTGFAQWANIYGIMSGTSSTTFSPNSAIKREDICVLFYNYITKYLGKSVSTAASSKFTDDANISGYARDAVYAMKNIGVVNGYTNGSFRPQGYATRAEVATMFKFLYDWRLKQ